MNRAEIILAITFSPPLSVRKYLLKAAKSSATVVGTGGCSVRRERVVGDTAGWGLAIPKADMGALPLQ